MTYQQITAFNCQCENCEHQWMTRNDTLPDRCPKCKARGWNKSTISEREASARIAEAPITGQPHTAEMHGQMKAANRIAKEIRSEPIETTLPTSNDAELHETETIYNEANDLVYEYDEDIPWN